VLVNSSRLLNNKLPTINNIYGFPTHRVSCDEWDSTVASRLGFSLDTLNPIARPSPQRRQLRIKVPLQWVREKWFSATLVERSPGASSPARATKLSPALQRWEKWKNEVPLQEEVTALRSDHYYRDLPRRASSVYAERTVPNGEVADMCTSFGFNCHPDRPCQLEQEWVSHWMRLFSYLRRKLRPSDLPPAGHMVPRQDAEERKAFAAKNSG